MLRGACAARGEVERERGEGRGELRIAARFETRRAAGEEGAGLFSALERGESRDVAAAGRLAPLVLRPFAIAGGVERAENGLGGTNRGVGRETTGHGPA
jgi:hypothetical protein